jgi:hypothetical protein
MDTDYQDIKFKDLTVKIIEVKATKGLAVHLTQLLNYLKATNIEVRLLLNFGSKPEIKRKVFDNFRKWYLSAFICENLYPENKLFVNSCLPPLKTEVISAAPIRG